MSSAKPSILYVAFHYPPVLGSSGVHRTLAFTRYLNDQGWSVNVLTASLKAYHNWSEEQLSFIPEKVLVIRAFARDVSRHFSWRGKYPASLALPDNWQSWVFGGLIAGLLAIFKRRPDFIVSTYPIASAHVIAYLLHRVTGVPWVADLRDPMAQMNYPIEPGRKRVFEWIERKIVKHCSFAVVTAPGAQVLYQERFPEVDKDFWQMIPNGFDEEIFRAIKVPAHTAPTVADSARPYVLLHSGIIYPSERDPSQLFAALSELKQEGARNIDRLQLRLRATGHDEIYSPQIEQLDIADLVKLEPPISYMQALEEMLEVDALLLLQADNCNYQIPAKAYEYIRANKPVLALTPLKGDTGKLLQEVGVTDISPLNDKNRIKQALLKFIDKLEKSEFSPIDRNIVNQYSRQYQAARFEALLKGVM